MNIEKFTNENTVKKPVIYIAYTNTGAGHIVPAMTTAKVIEEMYPNQFSITVCDFFSDAGQENFNKHLDRSLNMFIKFPITAKIAQTATNSTFLLSPHYVKIYHRKVYKESIRYIKSLDIDIFFTTHFFTYSLAVAAKRKYGLKFPVVGLNPDTFDTFSQWSNKGDLLVVSSDWALKRALKFGHKKEKVKVIPQILRNEFLDKEEKSKEVLRKEYGLREDVFTIFMSDGGQGHGQNYATLKALLIKKMTLNIIFICGKNEALYKKVIKLQEKLKKENHTTQIIAFSFIDKIAPLIQMSDLFIGKGGPATVLECLNFNLPVLINLLTNNAEERTEKYFKEKKVAISCHFIPAIPYKVKKMMMKKQILENIKNKISSLDIFENGSATIAQLLIDMLEKQD